MVDQAILGTWPAGMDRLLQSIQTKPAVAEVLAFQPTILRA
jgi:hypothetical protein